LEFNLCEKNDLLQQKKTDKRKETILAGAFYLISNLLYLLLLLKYTFLLTLSIPSITCLSMIVYKT